MHPVKMFELQESSLTNIQAWENNDNNNTHTPYTHDKEKNKQTALPQLLL